MCSLCPTKPSDSNSHRKNITGRGESPEGGERNRRGNKEGKWGHWNPKPWVESPAIQEDSREARCRGLGWGAVTGKKQNQQAHQGYSRRRPFLLKLRDRGINSEKGKESHEDCGQRSDIKRYLTISDLGALPPSGRTEHDSLHTVCIRII